MALLELVAGSVTRITRSATRFGLPLVLIIRFVDGELALERLAKQLRAPAFLTVAGEAG